MSPTTGCPGRSTGHGPCFASEGTGAAVSSGIREPWHLVKPPSGAEAAEYLQEWLQSSGEEVFNAVGLDLRGADFSGADFTEAWMSNTVLTSVGLRGVQLHRAHLEAADMTAADLTGANLTKASLNRAVLRGAKLDDADLTSASLMGVDARSASFRRARFIGGSVLDADFRGATLSHAVFQATSFVARLDDDSAVDGLTGSLYGPVTVADGHGERELGGSELVAWFTARGAYVEVLTPGSQP